MYGLNCMPTPICLDLADSEVQDGISQARVPNPIRLDLAVHQV